MRSNTDVTDKFWVTFIPKVLLGVEVRDLSRPVKFFHTNPRGTGALPC